MIKYILVIVIVLFINFSGFAQSTPYKLDASMELIPSMQNRTDEIDITVTLKNVGTRVIPHLVLKLKPYECFNIISESVDGLIRIECSDFVEGSSREFTFVLEIEPTAPTGDVEIFKEIKLIEPDEKVFHNLDEIVDLISIKDKPPEKPKIVNTIKDIYYNGDPIEFIYEYNDEDSNDIEYTIIIDGLSKVNSRIDKSPFKIVYTFDNPGYHKVIVNISDGYNFIYSDPIEVNISEKTYAKYLSEKMFYTNLEYFIIIALLALALIAFFLRFKIRLMKAIVSCFLTWLFLIVCFPILRDMYLFEIGIYALIIMSSAHFIVKNFPEEEKDALIWILSVVWIFISAILIILLIPYYNNMLYAPYLKEDYQYNIYSTISSLFGTILAIISAFAIWFLDVKVEQTEIRNAFNLKIKNIILFYIIILLLSLIGVIIGDIAPIYQYAKIDTVGAAISIFCFEASILFIGPAFACLFQLVDWIMDIKLEKL